MGVDRDRGVLGQVRTLFEGGTASGLTDGQLLERFSAGGAGAEASFAALVERQGPMVLGVCRAVLRDEHAAEDAFQATFLVLVRRARSLWVRDSLGPWLHQVARRTASGARADEARRRRRERQAAEWSVRLDRGRAPEDLGEVIHGELGRLAERYREAVLLCDVEGLTTEQAARRLGCPVGTVRSRLARGRGTLRRRLARLGVASSIGASPIPEAVRPPLRAGLSEITVRAASCVSTGRMAAVGGPSAPVISLMEGASRSMFFSKLAAVAAATLMTGVVAGSAVTLSRRSPAPIEPPVAVQEEGEQVVRPADGPGGDPTQAAKDREPRDEPEPDLLELLEQLRSPDPVPIRVGELPSERELAKARYETANTLVNELIRTLLEPPRSPLPDDSVIVDDILTWSTHRLGARIALCETKSDRIAALTEELGQLRRFEALCETLARGAASKVSGLDLNRIKYHRLGVEEALVRARGE